MSIVAVESITLRGHAGGQGGRPRGAPGARLSAPPIAAALGRPASRRGRASRRKPARPGGSSRTARGSGARPPGRTASIRSRCRSGLLDLQAQIEDLGDERDCAAGERICRGAAVGRVPISPPEGDGRPLAVVLHRAREKLDEVREERADLGDRRSRPPFAYVVVVSEERAPGHAGRAPASGPSRCRSSSVRSSRRSSCSSTRLQFEREGLTRG